MNFKNTSFIITHFLTIFLVLSFSSIYSQTTLKHSYTFENGTANDMVGNAHGTVVGGSFSDGAFYATAQGQYIQLPAASIAINTYSSFTIEAYLTPTKGENTGFTQFCFLGDAFYSGNYGVNYFSLSLARQDNFSRASISCGNTTSPWAAEDGVNAREFDDGRLHYVVATVDNLNISLYIDGIYIGSQVLSSNNQISSLSNADAFLCRSGYKSDPSWIGSIEEFNIYDGVLDEVTIAQRGEAIRTYEEIEGLTDENIAISKPYELHISSASTANALINSTIDIQDEEAVLIFDHIKPSLVLANLKNNILINGQPLVDGSNGRIAIYGSGTIILPQPPSFAPLTVYTQEGFTGESMQMDLHFYYNNLGSFDNAIKSFKLKRGYMATFASFADGTGYSRVFIADDADLNIDILQEELNATTSFIRVFKHQWVSKKGKAGWNPNDLDGTTYYDWNIAGGSSNDVEYVAIRQNGGWPSWTDINNKTNISHLLGFNEPDRPDQSNMQFNDMIAQWPSFMQSGLRIGSPAYSNPWDGSIGGNLFDFINKCDELSYRVDFVALHCYWGGKSPISWYNDLKYIHEATGRPLWITEWNNGANWTTEWWPDDTWELTDANAQKQLTDIQGILEVLDTASFVERYFIYDWVEDRRAMVLNGALTLAGDYYKQNASQLAYNTKNEVIPQWNFKDPELSSRYLSLANSIRLDWVDPNGDLSSAHIIEKKINDGSYEEIYNSENVSLTYYLDPLLPDIYGKITYRFKLLDNLGNSIISNEVTYMQTGNYGDIQLAELPINQTEWNVCQFTERLSTSPMVILGTPTHHNGTMLTRRVNTIGKTSFQLKIQPWNYLIQTLTEKENIPAIAILAGEYNFGGIAAKSNSIFAVNSNWTSVTFPAEFDVVPVVFCTQVSNNNSSSPTSIKIQNITTTGFEVCILNEEENTAAVSDETIHYLAIESGVGYIGNKRITVGQSANSEITDSYLLEHNTSYLEPILFSSLLTANDAKATTLSYESPGDGTFVISKDVEASIASSIPTADVIGWMIIDMSDSQTTGLKSESPLNPIHFYPNPITDVIHFDFHQLTKVIISDLTGQTVVDTKVYNKLDVSDLKEGIYIIKASGHAHNKMLKL